MNLQFDDLIELDQFLLWVTRYGAQAPSGYTGPPDDELSVRRDAADLEKAALAREEGFATQEEVATFLAGADDPEVEPEPPVEKPKRTRRTKAEIEAAKAALATEEAEDCADTSEVEKAQAEAEAASIAAMEAGATSAPIGNPFKDAQTTTANAAVEADAKPSGVAASADAIQARVAALMADGSANDPLAHLRLCSDAIRKHGISKYNETFNEELDANIPSYTPEQRALHIARIEALG